MNPCCEEWKARLDRVETVANDAIAELRAADKQRVALECEIKARDVTIERLGREVLRWSRLARPLINAEIAALLRPGAGR